MMVFVVMVALGSVAAGVIWTLVLIARRNGELSRELGRYALVAGKARQALADAQLHPQVDHTTATYLSVILSELDKDIYGEGFSHQLPKGSLH